MNKNFIFTSWSFCSRDDKNWKFLVKWKVIFILIANHGKTKAINRKWNEKWDETRRSHISLVEFHSSIYAKTQLNSLKRNE